ncbi:MAG: hypothetical protein CMP20_15755 [Rickettsiales bacterium]|nr:hypothetical protein [Rickettsiales bacterium]
MALTVDVIQATFNGSTTDVELCEQTPIPPRNTLFKLIYIVQADNQMDYIKTLFERDITRICKGCQSPIVFAEPRIGQFAETIVVEFWCWIPSTDSEKYWKERFQDDSHLVYNYDPRFDSFYSQTPR